MINIPGILYTRTCHILPVATISLLLPSPWKVYIFYLHECVLWCLQWYHSHLTEPTSRPWRQGYQGLKSTGKDMSSHPSVALSGKILAAILRDICQDNLIQYFQEYRYLGVRSAPADVLAPDGARTSAGIDLTKCDIIGSDCLDLFSDKPLSCKPMLPYYPLNTSVKFYPEYNNFHKKGIYKHLQNSSHFVYMPQCVKRLILR